MPDSDDLRHFFDTDQSVLIRKPVPADAFLAWLLPNDANPLRIQCVLFAEKKEALTITPLSFICESPMIELVEAKGKSWGLNTDLLDGKNCHVTGFPIGIHDPRDFVILGHDRMVIAPGTKYKFPRLDLAQATTHFELLRTRV